MNKTFTELPNSRDMIMLTDLPVLDGHRTFAPAPAHSPGARRFALTCSASLAALIIAMTAQPERAEAGCTPVGGTITVASGETCVDMRFGTAEIPSGSKLIVQQSGLVDTQNAAAISAQGPGVVVGDITISGTLRGDRISPSIGPNTIVFSANTASVGQITFTGTANVTGEANQQAFNLFTAPLIAGIDTGGTITVTQHAWGIGSTTATTASTVNVTGDIVNRGTATTGTLGTTERFYFDVQQATVGGSIMNEVGGKILGAGDTPIRLLGTRVEKDVANKGELGAAGTAVGTGISIGRGNIASSIGGNVINSGSIWATAAGLAVADTAVNGKIENSNAIVANGTGADAIRVAGGTTVSGSIANSSAGKITATRYGMGLLGTAASSAGSISNSGEITAGTAGIYAGSGWTINGSLENAAGGKLLGSVTGISLVGTTVSGAVSNDATISATTTGIGITAASNIGAVQNKANGKITVTTASADGIAIADSTVGTEVSNAGEITARRYGISLTNVNAGVTAPATVLKNTGTITTSSTATPPVPITAGLFVMFTEETGFEAALGLEYDIDRSANDFSGTSPIPGFESFSFEHDDEDGAKLRPAGMMSLFHDLTPTQRISATVTAGQDVWSENFQGSALVAYRFSF